FLYSLHAPPATQIYTLSLHDALPISHLIDEADQVLGNLVAFLPERRERLGQRRLHAIVHAKCLEQRKNHGEQRRQRQQGLESQGDRKSTRLNSSHRTISYAVFCLKKK